jgi:hypothetical protein
MIKAIARVAIEMILFTVLAAGMLLGVIWGSSFISDENTRYFVIGYYVAVHANLARWIWKKLGIEKAPLEDDGC